VVEDMLELDSGPDVVYSDKKIVCHVLNASVSQTSVNNISNLCSDAPSEETVRHRLSNLELGKVLKNLNEKLKIHACETVPRNFNPFAIDFVNIPYYGEEETSGDTIKTKLRQGTSRFYAYASIYLILNNKRL
jgi:putative transposase